MNKIHIVNIACICVLSIKIYKNNPPKFFKTGGARPARRSWIRPWTLLMTWSHNIFALKCTSDCRKIEFYSQLQRIKPADIKGGFVDFVTYMYMYLYSMGFYDSAFIFVATFYLIGCFQKNQFIYPSFALFNEDTGHRYTMSLAVCWKVSTRQRKNTIYH